MKNRKRLNFFLIAIFILSFSEICSAQTKSLIKRTTYKTENVKFAAGGTISIVGAPNGSVLVEGWQKNEVEISAEIEVNAETETDLAQLAQVIDFVLDENFGHLSIRSVGTHDRIHLKKFGEKFPKSLLTMPFRIDYRIKVPDLCNLEIDGGRGDLNISKVVGAMRINFLHSNAKINLESGNALATFGFGNINVSVASRLGRASRVNFQMANGAINVGLANNLNAEISAKILRAGHIENIFSQLKPHNRAKFTEKLIDAKIGDGGAKLLFTVGDGTIKIQDFKFQGNNLER
ncbi:MAG: hypothetical protein H0U96_01380 [Acidobacteria bacterium]|jgi:hypothetical protein|nr:hypothetical protein [Acidobacteriota bacterium]